LVELTKIYNYKLKKFSILSKICYVCKEQIGPLGGKREYNDYLQERILLPEGMTKLDVTCRSCYNEAEETYKQKVQEEKIQNTKVTQGLLARTPEYKKKWNKNGIIQFKNERIAILHRAYGAQVEFIIAFDDLTAEGYELKEIDNDSCCFHVGVQLLTNL